MIAESWTYIYTWWYEPIMDQMLSYVHSKISWNPGNASPTQHVLSSVKNVNPTLKKKKKISQSDL